MKLLVLALFCLFPLIAAAPSYESTIRGFTLFEGDAHGDFKGDFVAHLYDGSAWKIHPKDRKKVEKWSVDERVHIEVRTSRYWKKREHKFFIYNDDRNEPLRTMLVDYGCDAAEVIDASTVYIYGSRSEPVYGIDRNGNYDIIYWERVYDEAMDVTLDSGFVCAVTKHFRSYDPGHRIYLGCNRAEKRDVYFLISGIEREAVYSWLNSIENLSP